MIRKILALVLAMVMLTACLAGCKSDKTVDGGGPVAPDQLPGIPENAVAYTENFGLTENQMLYYFTYAYESFVYYVESYGLQLSYFGIDPNKSLKDQPCTADDSFDTWFDYFLSEAKSTAVSTLVVCEAALEADYELNDELVKTIEESIDGFRKGAEEAGKDYQAYIEERFGFPITEETLVNTLILSTYSGAYADHVESQADVSDEAIEKAYQENRLVYETFDFLAYEVTPKDISEDATLEDCKAIVEKVAKAKDADEFKSLAKTSMKNDLKLSADDLKDATDKLENTKVEYDNSKLHDIFASAEEGQIGFFVDEETKIATAFMFLKTNPRDDSDSARSVRHILFTRETYKDDTKAREVYDKWVADGAKVEDFAALAAEYSEDTGSNQNGGLYDKFSKGETVKEFDAWLFDDSRKPGDHALVETKDFGWHIMYYVGGMPAWKSDMISYIKSNAYYAMMESAEGKFEIRYNDEAIKNLDV